MTDSSGWGVRGLERWRRKTESLILSKVQEVQEESAEGCGLQGKSHLHRKQWPHSQELKLEIDSLFFVIISPSFSVPELSVLLMLPQVAAALKDTGESAQTDPH